MSGLHSIPIRVETGPGSHTERGNAIAILYEVRHALGHLTATGEATRIDLSAMPFGPGDEEHLSRLLGTGEVAASVEALGPTRVQETAVPGVWLVDYRNAQGERLALHLEIARVPEILCTQDEDLATAVATLDARLATVQGDQRLQS